MTPDGRMSRGSAAPFTSTSPLTPKFNTKGYTALSSGPTTRRRRLNRSGSCSSEEDSAALFFPAAGVSGGELDERCKNPASPRRAPAKGFTAAPPPPEAFAAPPPAADPDPAGAAFGCKNAVPLDRRSDPPTSGSSSVPFTTRSASSRPLYAARARTSRPDASARMPPWTSARATSPSHVSPLAPRLVCSTGTAPLTLIEPRGPHLASMVSA